ncbi:MAG: HEPN domain-containing protein [Kiritimatiellales bacterium]|nr:HEPN domain-containing protein [Kiritimatiellales bacterium]
MPYEQPACGTPEDWLSRARSDLALASVRRTKRIRSEDLCYHAQQSVEKTLKAVLIHSRTAFPRTHNIKVLVELLPAGLFRDPILNAAAILTDYAVTTRYPGEVEPVTPDELQAARHIAREVLAWAEAIIGH